MEFYVRDWAAWRDGRSDGGFLQDPRRSLWDSWPLFVLVERRKCSLNFCEGNRGIGAGECGLLIDFFSFLLFSCLVISRNIRYSFMFRFYLFIFFYLLYTSLFKSD